MMKTMLHKTVFLLMIVLLFVPACTLPNTSEPTAKAITETAIGGPTLTPSATKPGDPTFTPSPTKPGDPTFTPSPTKPGDPTFTPSATLPGGPSFTPSPTLVGPSVIALKNANCRYGPGTAYDIADTLFAGQSALIVGRNEQSTWWQIHGPALGSLCWVSQITVQVNGPGEGVPVAVAPPPPTVSPEPRPQKPRGCYVFDALGRKICTVPCPANAVPGGACKP